MTFQQLNSGQFIMTILQILELSGSSRWLERGTHYRLMWVATGERLSHPGARLSGICWSATMSNELDPIEAAQELVIRTTPTQQLALDQHVKLLAEMKECQDMERFWKKRLERLKEQAAKLMGDNEVGTINGEKALTYQWEDRFNSTDFRRQYPNMYELYSHEVTEKKFDANWLKRARPDLYKQFQVRSMKLTYEPPGQAPTP